MLESKTTKNKLLKTNQNSKLKFKFKSKQNKNKKRRKQKMRIIIQRVLSGSVTKLETGEVVGKIGRGLLLYFGINEEDVEKDIETAVSKVLKMKLFDGEDGKRWNKSVMDMGYEVLVVSQFTLYAVLNGAKPDFHKSMRHEKSEPFFELVVKKFKELYAEDKIQTGAFGQHMIIGTEVDGPVNIILDYPKENDKQQKKQPKQNQNQPKQQKGQKSENQQKQQKGKNQMKQEKKEEKEQKEEVAEVKEEQK